MLVSLYTVRAILSALGVVDYGVYNAIGGVVTSLSFITGVMANASQRFFSLEIGVGKGNKLESFFNAILTLYIILSIVIVLIIESGGIWFLEHKLTIPVDRMYAAKMVLHYSLAAFIITIITNPFQALLIAYEKMNVYAYVSIIEVVLKLLIVFLLYHSPMDKLVYYALLIFIVTVVVNSIYVLWCLKYSSIRYRIKLGGKEFKEIFSYSSWTLFGTISGVASIQGCSIVLNVFCGPIANTAFAIATQISNVIQQFASSFFTAVRPPLTKSYGAGAFDYMKRLYDFSNKTLFTLTFAVVFPLFVKAEFILELWLGETSPYMACFVRTMMIYAMVMCLNNPITTIVQAAGRVKIYHLVVDGFSLTVLPLLYIFFLLGLDANYCLIVNLLVFTIAHILRLLVLRRVVNYSVVDYCKRFFIPVLWVIIICSIIIGLFCSILENSIIASLSIVALCIITSILSSFVILFSKEERLQLVRLIKK
jgi:O-antigen/teichoic acid export membrane protein